MTKIRRCAANHNDQKEENSSSCDEEQLKDDVRACRQQRRHVQRRLRALLVIQLNPSVEDSFIQWIVSKIRTSETEGGAGMRNSKGTLLLLAAPTQRLLEIAHIKKIPRKSIANRWRSFDLQIVNIFLHPGMCANQIFTGAEKQKILIEALGDFRAFPPDLEVPTHNLIFCPGEIIISRLIKCGIIEHIFPLHEENEFKKITCTLWIKAMLYSSIALDTIQRYYGDAIALNLAFFGLTTRALTFISLLGILSVLNLFGEDKTIENDPWISILCAFNCFTMIAVYFIWRRRCCFYSYTWGNYRMQGTSQGPRAGYKGKVIRNCVSGWCENWEPEWKLTARVNLKIIKIIFVCLILFYCSLSLFRGRRFFFFLLCIGLLTYAYAKYGVSEDEDEEENGDSKFAYLIGFALSLWLLKRFGKRMIYFLTDWENHRTSFKYEKYKISKAANYFMVSSIAPIFYFVYILDFETASKLHITMIVINHVMRYIMDFVFKLFGKLRSRRSCSYKFWGKTRADGCNIDPPEDPVVVAARSQSKLKCYYGQFDENYLFPMTQFAVILMFSSISPLAAPVAVVGNILWIIIDYFILRGISQRPFVQPSRCCSVSAWKLVFDFLATLVVIINCEILAHSIFFRNLMPFDVVTDAEWVLLVVAIEHVFIVTKYLFNQFLPELSSRVRKLVEDEDFEENSAIANERYLSLKRLLLSNQRKCW